MIDEGKILSRHEIRSETSEIAITTIIITLAFVIFIITLSLTTSLCLTDSFFFYFVYYCHSNITEYNAIFPPI